MKRQAVLTICFCRRVLAVAVSVSKVLRLAGAVTALRPVAARSLVRRQTGSMARRRWPRERLPHGTLIVSRVVLRALRQSLDKRT